ncbi:MAG: class I mannose-6-phosphate isomerase [Planctomycetaceae bacterium]|nr:class I mannose-6-phosphate isomerase [Planctomycetaceae bacterium]
MPSLYPLRFKPTFRRYLWGGRRLETVLHKPLGPGDDYAESWEIVDHGQDQSIISHGELANSTLNQIVTNFPNQLFGKQGHFDSFPLLFKFLDAKRDLSVQVHPNDEQGSQLSPPDRGKTEAWVILDSEPESKLYAGLKRGFDRAALAREVARGTTELCLHSFHPEPGQCLFIPAGLVHAIGAGLLVAEIQQSSDTTFRLFDWNRVDATGEPRQLHIEESLETINYNFGPATPQTPQPTADPSRERLVVCDKFILDRQTGDSTAEIGGDGRFHIIAVVEGSLNVSNDPASNALTLGQTMLLPACSGKCHIEPTEHSTWLDIYLPSAEELSIE